MVAPEKIYIQTYAGEAFSSKWTTIPFRDFENTEYIRKDYVDEMLKTAEDHAYFAGQEKFREKLIEWLERKMTKEKATEGFVGGYDFALKCVINKINSM